MFRLARNTRFCVAGDERGHATRDDALRSEKLRSNLATCLLVITVAGDPSAEFGQIGPLNQ